MKNLLSLLLLIGGVGLFFGYTQNIINDIKEYKVGNQKLAEAEKNLNDIKKIKDREDATLKSITLEQDRKIRTMLPDSVENVKLIIDIGKIVAETMDASPQAGLYKVRDVENPKISENVGKVDFGVNTVSKENLGAVTFSFSVGLTYTDFRTFLQKLERSTRLFDIEEITFNNKEVNVGASGENAIYNFNIKLRTYWHKQNNNK